MLQETHDILKLPKAVHTPLGRFYATSRQAQVIFHDSAQPLRTSTTLILGLWGAGLAVPSLTTLISLGKGLTARNADMSADHKQAQAAYLLAVKALLAKEQEGGTGVSLRGAMSVGTAVHSVAEARNNWALGQSEAGLDFKEGSEPWNEFLAQAFEPGWGNARDVPFESLGGFQKYIAALKTYFAENSEPLVPELTLVRERWAGTLDGLGATSVVDFKTGIRLELKKNLVQAVTLSRAAGRSSAAVVWLRQDKTYREVKVTTESPIWDLAVGQFEVCLATTEAVLGGLLNSGRAEEFILFEEADDYTGSNVTLTPQQAAWATQAGKRLAFPGGWR